MSEQHPLIRMTALLVEDKSRELRQKKRLLESHGFTIVSANTKTRALKQYLLYPSVDLILTDIDLLGGVNVDFSGADFAREVRQMNPWIPIIGYSAKIPDADELRPGDMDYFTDYIPKASLTPSELNSRIAEIIIHVEKYKNWRSSEANRQVKRLSGKYGITHWDSMILNRFLVGHLFGDEHIDSTAGNGEELDIDSYLAKGGYKLEVIEKGASRETISGSKGIIKSSFVVGVRTEPPTTMIEVYGFPTLIGVGESCDEAKTDLLIIMDGFYNYLVLENPLGKDLGTISKQLRDFLLEVFGEIDATHNH